MFETDLLHSIENPDNEIVADAQRGDEVAEEALIRKYTGLVMSKAKAYFMAGADENDVIQEGMIGLLKAVRHYDPEKNASFATFADVCVTRQIIDAIRSAERVKHKALNTSLSLNVPAKAANSGSSDAAQADITLEDTIEDNEAEGPEATLLIKDVTYYILNNGDNIFSDFEMQVLTEYMKGYTCEQIAQKLGKSPKSIDNAIQRTKKKVSNYLWK